MKKALLLLILSLLLSCASAEVFNPANEQEAWLLALDCLAISGFGAEYSSDTERLTRWEEPIYLHSGGVMTVEDQHLLDSFIAELRQNCPGLPPICSVERSKDANLIITYCPLDEMADHMEDYVEGNWGLFTYWYEDYERNYAEIVVASDITSQVQRNHILMEELVGALGLSNDHFLYEDSIVYAPWTETQALSEVDWLMLNMLYDPALSCGMEYGEAREILLEQGAVPEESA